MFGCLDSILDEDWTDPNFATQQANILTDLLATLNTRESRLLEIWIAEGRPLPADAEARLGDAIQTREKLLYYFGDSLFGGDALDVQRGYPDGFLTTGAGAGGEDLCTQLFDDPQGELLAALDSPTCEFNEELTSDEYYVITVTLGPLGQTSDLDVTLSSRFYLDDSESTDRAYLPSIPIEINLSRPAL